MNNELPLVTVLMANWNTEKYVRQAIESILNQTYKNLEFIIVDDCSSDGSLAILEALASKDSRIKVLRNEENLKICKTLNKGEAEARGVYIVRMDHDDIALPNRIERQVAFMERSENANVGVCGSFVEIIDENGKSQGEKKFPQSNEEVREAFWFQNPIQHSSAIIRKKCFEEFGGYDPDFVYAEDLELWLRFGQKYELRNISEVLLQYRVHGTNKILTSQKTMIKNAMRARSLAHKKYGYRVPKGATISNIITFVTLFLPSRMVYWIFTKLRAHHVQRYGDTSSK